MRTKSLSQATKMKRVSNAVAVGTTSVNTASIDRKGYNSVMFWCAFGAITDGTPTIKVQQSDDDSTWADLAGTLVTGAITDDNKALAVDVSYIAKRYARLVIGRGGATGAVIDDVMAIAYEANVSKAGDHDASVAVIETHASPIEGTA